MDIDGTEDTGRPYLIEWTDSGMSSDEWEGADSFLDRAGAKLLAPVRTIGFYIGEDENVVCVAQSHDEGADNYYNFQAILKSCVTKRGFFIL